jgi:hypothetical protein
MKEGSQTSKKLLPSTVFAVSFLSKIEILRINEVTEEPAKEIILKKFEEFDSVNS